MTTLYEECPSCKDLAYGAEGPRIEICTGPKISSHACCAAWARHLTLICFDDLSASGRYRSLGILQSKCRYGMHLASCKWSYVKRNDCDDFPDTVIIIGLRIEMSVLILNALYKNRISLLFYFIGQLLLNSTHLLWQIYETSNTGGVNSK